MTIFLAEVAGARLVVEVPGPAVVVQWFEVVVVLEAAQVRGRAVVAVRCVVAAGCSGRAAALAGMASGCSGWAATLAGEEAV